MKRLDILSSPPSFIDRFTEIRNSKRGAVRPRLTAAHASIAAQYASFEQAILNNTLNLFRHDPALKSIKAELRACYNGDTKSLARLKKQIKEIQAPRRMKFCPMCNTTLPLTYDHYLAADLFPELSVHGLNLVPCCSKCNSTKGDDWLSTAGSRQFLHVYSDPMPSVRFLECDLHTRAGFLVPGATFRLAPPAGAIVNWPLIEAHFAKLDLISRYDELSNNEISEILQTCRLYLDNGGSDVEGFLRALIVAKEADYGLNYWWAVLAEALLADSGFSGWL